MNKVSHFSHLLPEDDIVGEDVRKIYEMIMSEVQSDYAGKFDATAANKQWAVAARMFMTGMRYQEVLHAGYRERVIRELIEKALGSEADDYRSYDGYVAEWLKDQLKGE